MNTQIFIVIIIGLVVLYITARAIYRFFFKKDLSSSAYCGNCNACDLNPNNMDNSHCHQENIRP